MERRVEGPPARCLETPDLAQTPPLRGQSNPRIRQRPASTNDVSDTEVLPELLQGVAGELEQVSADGAYDQLPCYDALNRHRARAAIPPRKGARIWSHANGKAERHVHDENLRRVRKVRRKQWKRESGYHRRSLAETQVFRFKAIFCNRLQGRQIDN
jgi:hypothetical protein